EYIKKLQGILKKGTSDEENPLKVVGDFKRINNIINNTRLGDTQTSRAADVPRDLKALIERWEQTDHLKMKDFADFHYAFENIHPFSDGNGRVGRILLFKARCRNYL